MLISEGREDGVIYELRMSDYTLLCYLRFSLHIEKLLHLQHHGINCRTGTQAPSLHLPYSITALPHYSITALPHYRITALPHYRITALPHYRITALTEITFLLLSLA